MRRGNTYDGVAAPQFQSCPKCVMRCSFFSFPIGSFQDSFMCWSFSLGAVEGFTPLCLGRIIRPIICLFFLPSQAVVTYSCMWHQQCAHAYITWPVFCPRILYLLMTTLRRPFVVFAPLLCTFRTEQKQNRRLSLGGTPTEHFGHHGQCNCILTAVNIPLNGHSIKKQLINSLVMCFLW